MNTRSIFAPTFDSSHYGIVFSTKHDGTIRAIVVGDQNNRLASIEAVYLGQNERKPLTSLKHPHLVVVEGILTPPKHRGDSFRLIATDAASDAQRLDAQGKCLVRINTHNPAKAEGDGWIEIPESDEAGVEIVARGNYITGVDENTSSTAEDYLLVMNANATVKVYFEGIDKPYYFSPLCGLKLVQVDELASENEQTTTDEAPPRSEPDQPSVH